MRGRTDALGVGAGRWSAVIRPPDLPALAAGQTLLVAESGDLERYNVDLRIAAARSDPSEGTVFVTTETDGERMYRRYRSVGGDDASEPFGVVDAVSRDQNLPAPHEEPPTVYVSAPHELARLSLALAELTRSRTHAARRRHLVFQSLTPLLESSDASAVARFVREATRGPRTVDGFSIFRVDFTAHDERALERLRGLADFVLWVEGSADETLDFDLERSPRPTEREGRGRTKPSDADPE